MKETKFKILGHANARKAMHLVRQAADKAGNGEA